MASKTSSKAKAPAKKAAPAKAAAKKSKSGSDAKQPQLGKVPAVNPAMLGDVASAHSTETRRKYAAPKELPEGVVELGERPEAVPDPIKGFLLETEQGKADAEEDQQPVYVTEKALEEADKEVVSRETLQGVYDDLNEYRSDIDSEMPDLVPAYNKLLTGVLEFMGAVDARRQRILQEGTREALGMIRAARQAEIDEEDNEKAEKDK